MLYLQKVPLRQRLLYSCILFALILAILGYAVGALWFREDDLGEILNGLIRGWHDFVRVFSADCRSFITPCNYQRTVPNVISGFLRPMQNVVYSIIYQFWGTNPWPYYLVHVGFHAANAVLLFNICLIWIPIFLSFIAGLLFAFYPDVTWLIWIGAMQNSIMTFFILISILLFYGVIHMPAGWRRTSIYVLMSVSYFFSLLSRESGIFLPFWFFLGAYFFVTNVGSRWWLRIKQAFSYTWIFFLANILYVGMRLWAFGIESLPRTMHNIVLRYPFLVRYVQARHHVAAALYHPSVLVEKVHNFDVSCHAQSLLAWITDRFLSWLQVVSSIHLSGGVQQFLALISFVCMAIFLLCAYWRRLTILLWLLFGLGCVLWPGVVAYPCARYINLAYPFVIVIIIGGVYMAHKYMDDIRMRFFSLVIMAAAFYAIGYGAYRNSVGLRSNAHDRAVYKQRFEDFFTRYSFPADARFVVVSSPFVPDIQSVFQTFTGNLATQVVTDMFASLAEFGCMGCRKPYRVAGVPSTIIPVPGGFRLVSQDPEHCGWWLRFSDFPIAWSAKDRAYRWTTEPYRQGVWYPCSVGTFRIDNLVDADCAADITFIYDRQWVNAQTVFVAWDTMRGRYEVIERGSY